MNPNHVTHGNVAPNQELVMKRYYWLRDSFAHLVNLTPRADLPEETAAVPDRGYSLAYPKSTLGACRELQVRGLDVSVAALDDLTHRELVQPMCRGLNHEWSADQIDFAAEYFDDAKSWMTTTHFCRMADLEFGQAAKAYRVAAARFGLPFRMDFELRNLVAVVEPASEPTAYGWVSFHPRGTSLRCHDLATEKQVVSA